MQQTMVEFQVQVFRNMAFWLWEDPISVYHLLKPIEGTNYTVTTKWTPETRVGRFFEKNFKISAYMDENRSPAEKGQALRQNIIELLLPLAPILQQQGMAINWEYLLKTLGEYSRMPELRRAIEFLGGEQIPPKQMQSPGMPSQTTRNYTRTNRSVGSQGQNESALVNAVFSQESPESQLASLFQQTG
jgi:hypothetical protein